MMARNFRPHLVSWGGAAAVKRRPSTPREPSPEDDAADDVADLKKQPAAGGNNSDSDHETASAASTEPTSTPPTHAAAGVASSFARAGKLLWGGARNPLSGLAALTKQHSRTVSDFSESDFTTPFAPNTPVWTRYGLGTVITTRADDGFLIVALQGLGRMTLYLNPADEDYYSVPAIRHDWVDTPAGEGLVVGFDAKQQSYRVRLGGSGARSDVDVNVHRSDLRRLMPVRRQTHAPHHAHGQQQQPQPQPAAATATAPAPAAEASAISKGFNSAFKTIVTTSSGLSNSLSNYYYQGQCVVTTFGQGTIVALDQTSHRAQVQLTWGATAFLSTDAVLHYTKALVGMEVTTTKFGSGVVTDMRPADGMYTVKVQTLNKETGEPQDETVYVHESDLVRGGARRLRLGSAPKQITEKIGASTTKLFSFASSTVKLFGHGGSSAASPPPAGTAVPAKATPSPSSHAVKTPAPVATPSRCVSTRIIESDDEHVSSAGI